MDIYSSSDGEHTMAMKHDEPTNPTESQNGVGRVWIWDGKVPAKIIELRTLMPVNAISNLRAFKILDYEDVPRDVLEKMIVAFNDAATGAQKVM